MQDAVAEMQNNQDNSRIDYHAYTRQGKSALCVMQLLYDLQSALTLGSFPQHCLAW